MFTIPPARPPLAVTKCHTPLSQSQTVQCSHSQEPGASSRSHQSGARSRIQEPTARSRIQETTARSRIQEPKARKPEPGAKMSMEPEDNTVYLVCLYSSIALVWGFCAYVYFR